MAAGITVWLLGQMMINVGMVLALLPVIGIPLPLVSYGGSALLPSLVALGLLVGFARSEPEAARALAARRKRPRSAGLCRHVPIEVTDPMRVLLAGGGTAGHTSPLLATADALAPARPGRRDHLPRHAARVWRPGVVPEAGYPLELIPPVPLPRRPNADLLRVPGRLRGAVKATLEVVDRVRPDVVVGFGGYVSVPAYLAARRRKLPLVVHEQNALPGIANTARRPVHAARRHVSFPDTPLPQRDVRRPADPPDDLHARPGRRCAPRPARSSASTPTGRRCWSPAAPRARAGSTSPSPAPQPRSRDGRRPGAPRRRARRARRDAADRPARPYVVVPYVDRMDLAYAAADLVRLPGRRQHA